MYTAGAEIPRLGGFTGCTYYHVTEGPTNVNGNENTNYYFFFLGALEARNYTYYSLCIYS